MNKYQIIIFLINIFPPKSGGSKSLAHGPVAYNLFFAI